jgi:hypothetical protein
MDIDHIIAYIQVYGGPLFFYMRTNDELSEADTEGDSDMPELVASSDDEDTH